MLSDNPFLHNEKLQNEILEGRCLDANFDVMVGCEMIEVSKREKDFPKHFKNQWMGWLVCHFEATEELRKNHNVSTDKRTIKFVGSATLVSGPCVHKDGNHYAWVLTSAHNLIKQVQTKGNYIMHQAKKAEFILWSGCDEEYTLPVCIDY